MRNETPSTPPASSAVCASCNRYIGPVGRCPYCSADTPQPLILRLLRWGSLLLAVLGLVLLYLAVTHRDVPIASIADITPMMNYAVVRLVGTVPRDCYVGDNSGRVDYVSFLVNDDTGSIRVKARGAVAGQLADAHCLPMKGMRVDVTGTLYVKRDRNPEMRLRSARQVIIGASTSP